jgi:hypothetical protein
MQALLHGMALRPDSGPHDPKRKPTDLEMRRAIEAAQSATLHGIDSDGVAASMLYLNDRNALLEGLRQDVARYVHGGQDARLHSDLVRDLARLAPPGQEIELPIPL